MGYRSSKLRIFRPWGLRRWGEGDRAAMRDRTHELRQVRIWGTRMGGLGWGLTGMQDSQSSGQGAVAES